ncbi:MAG: hypothetical protein QOE35_527 [Actinomycetota bacterium]|jgi:hypothetical protein
MEQSQVKHVPLKEAVASVRVQHRDRIHAVARWSLSDGHPVPMEHVALIIAAKGGLDGDAETLDHWTGGDVEDLPGAIAWWCEERHTMAPPGLAASLSTYMRFLADQQVTGGGGTKRRRSRPA